MIGYFITGTDTNVGKTYVAAMLARRARAKTTTVFAFKPIETGCEDDLGVDQRELVEAAGSWQTGSLRGALQFERAVAPRPAARTTRRSIDVDELVELARQGSRSAQLTIIEGAGGWRVPISDDIDMAAFAKRLELPVVVVARADLGTINHSLLTLEAVERDGCEVAAFVMSRRPDVDCAFALENLDEVRRRWSGRCILVEEDPSVLDPLIPSFER